MVRLRTFQVPEAKSTHPWRAGLGFRGKGRDTWGLRTPSENGSPVGTPLLLTFFGGTPRLATFGFPLDENEQHGKPMQIQLNAQTLLYDDWLSPGSSLR